MEKILCSKLTSSEIRNIAQQVEHRNYEDRDGAVPLDDGHGPLDLVDDVEGVGVARVREDDVDERAGEVVAVRGGAFERVAVVDSRVGDVVDVAAEDDEACYADTANGGDVSKRYRVFCRDWPSPQDQSYNFQDSEDIGGPERVLVMGDDTWSTLAVIISLHNSVLLTYNSKSVSRDRNTFHFPCRRLLLCDAP